VTRCANAVRNSNSLFAEQGIVFVALITDLSFHGHSLLMLILLRSLHDVDADSV
jgi:hypothetical protein